MFCWNSLASQMLAHWLSEYKLVQSHWKTGSPCLYLWQWIVCIANNSILNGNACVTPWLIHVNVWQKSLQYCKVISLQLINGKKKRNSCVSSTKGIYKNAYNSTTYNRLILETIQMSINSKNVYINYGVFMRWNTMQ